MSSEFTAGAIGTAVSAVGTATQTNEVLQTISLCITIAGGIMTLIVLPLINWYRKSKKDGKIDKDEVKEAIDIVKDGIEDIKDKVDDSQKD